MSRRITFVGVARFTDRVMVAGYSPSEADDTFIIKEVRDGSYKHLSCPKNTAAALFSLDLVCGRPLSDSLSTSSRVRSEVVQIPSSCFLS